MGQLTGTKHVLRNNVHERNHNLLVIHLCLTYLVLILSFSESLLAFFLHFQFPLLCGLKPFCFSPWILCHSYFRYIFHLSVLSAGVLVQKNDTLISVNYHTQMHTCPQCCLWFIAKALHTSPQPVPCITSTNRCSPKLFFIIAILFLSAHLRHFLEVAPW